jgi:hypothetical protein
MFAITPQGRTTVVGKVGQGNLNPIGLGSDHIGVSLSYDFSFNQPEFHKGWMIVSL